MSAVIVFTEGDPWFVNSRNWSFILERILERVPIPDRRSFDWFVNEVGLDFPSVDPSERPSVARLVLAVVGGLPVTLPAAGEPASSTHYGDLVAKLTNEIRVNADLESDGKGERR